MRMRSMRAALVCAALAITATAAMAGGKPIPGVDIVVHKHPGGHSITATTDENGQIVLKDLAPGDYEIDIDGKTLVAVIDNLTLAVPEKKSGGLSLGIGLFGGGSSHSSSHQGAGPVQGGSHGGSSNGGGEYDRNIFNSTNTTGEYDRTSDPTGTLSVRWEQVDPRNPTGGLPNLIETPYCRDGAKQGMGIGFTILQGGGPVTVELSYVDPRLIGAATGAHF